MQSMAAKTQADWSGLRDLLEFARAGSLEAASVRLGIDATTLARRIKRLEQDQGTALTLHNGRRLELTPAGRKAVATATLMELEAERLSRQLLADEPAVQGAVRVTSLHSILRHFLLPQAHALHQRHPGLILDLIAESRNLSLARQEADIAIRFARPAGADLIVRKLADIPYAIFGAKDAGWIAYDESLMSVPEAQWVATQIPAHQIVLRTNAQDVVIDAVKAGHGQALLPVFACDGIAAQTGTVLTREAWLVLHRDTRNTPRIRVVADWIASLFEKADQR